MKQPTVAPKLFFFAFLSCSGLPCAAQSLPTAEEKEGVQEITRFLETWFVQRDFERALDFLSPEESICLPARRAGEGEHTLLPRELARKRLEAEMREAIRVVGQKRRLKGAIEELPEDSRTFFEELDLKRERRFTVLRTQLPLSGGECEGFNRVSSTPQLTVAFVLKGSLDESYPLYLSFEIFQGEWRIVFFDQLTV